MSYRKDIDGLRAFAVMIVVLYHFDFNLFSGGYVGVDIFLVISGYLITGIIKEKLEAGKFSFSNFFIRRLRRLYPALLFTGIFTTILASLVYTPNILVDYAKSLLASFLFSSNIFFFYTVNYFNSSVVTKPLLHTWSLSLEEQFYFVYPLFLYLIYKKNSGFNRKSVSIMSTLLVISIALSEYFVRSNSSAAFYLIFFRAGEFIIGGLLVWLDLDKIKNIYADIVFVLGLGLVLVSSMSYTEQYSFPGVSVLVPCIGAALLIIGGKRSRLNFLFTNKASVLIGNWSYSLYLLHWPLVVIYKYIINRDLFLTEKCGLVFTSITLSFICYSKFENIFRDNMGKWDFSNKTVVKFSILSSLAVILLGITIIKSKGWPWRYSQELQPVAQLGLDGFSKMNYGGKECINIKQNYSCHIQNGKGSFIVAGDSHAEMHFAGLKALSKKTNMSFSLFTEGSCGFFTTKSTYRDDNDCVLARENFLNYLKNNPKSNLIISHRWWLYIKENQSLDDFSDYIVSNIENMLNKANFSGKLMIIGQVPELPGYGGLYDCILRFKYLPGERKCKSSPVFYKDIDRNLKLNAKLAKSFRQLQIKSKVVFINPYQTFCDERKCNQIGNDSKLYYSDSNHLSVYGAKMLAKDYIPAYINM
jgi:peptidoglycan/LPS O-acetylase OafA/YrhL